MNKIIELSDKVKLAFQTSKPIIALESTIIAHGMPYPENLQVAQTLEAIAEEEGVVPATICLMDGKIKIGLNQSELKKLATAGQVKKVSRREIGKVLAQGIIGATTVAATMFCAQLVNIKIFATGGIGGVHRGAENSFDISADLHEFTSSPVIVVSAGVKAILDIPKTLEMLETLRVPVLGYKTTSFPAFYSSNSPYKVEKIDSAAQIAEIYKLEQRLGLRNGMLIANPIPTTEEIPFFKMEKIITSALKIAKKQNITGQAVTPFLLKKIVTISQGQSLQANIALVKNNVHVACQIAKELV
ncbi:MAG: pseudouridine-5'-phosphate glycosidase [Candidatus Cloacimonadota bacterium]|nr:pseudouridine-5'-phosphate glycosidase [Candidatus Cloacimonadota bacterium]